MSCPEMALDVCVILYCRKTMGIYRFVSFEDVNIQHKTVLFI